MLPSQTMLRDGPSKKILQYMEQTPDKSVSVPVLVQHLRQERQIVFGHLGYLVKTGRIEKIDHGNFVLSGHKVQATVQSVSRADISFIPVDEVTFEEIHVPVLHQVGNYLLELIHTLVDGRMLMQDETGTKVYLVKEVV